jgi:hypothetical protein
MSEEPSREKLQGLLSTLYQNIVQYMDEDMLPSADRNFYSTRDYAMGDTVSCTPDTALDNCQQLRGYFPRSAPRSVFDNIEQIEQEIRRIEAENRPSYVKRLFIILVLAGLAIAAYYLLQGR